jgi:internalin A
MRKFSLCFPFPDEVDRYSVPELLGKEEPKEAGEFPARECLNFEYQYGVLPEGLMPRFIVKSNSLSRGQQRWRSGVILAREDCKALVNVEPANRRVVVRVKGGDSGARRNLLAIIRYDFDRINSEFKEHLDVQLNVPLLQFPEFTVDYKKLVAFENQGVREFPEVVGDKIVSVSVNDLLSGIDFRIGEGKTLQKVLKVESLFLSYSHKDETLRDELETHLKLLARQGVISLWHDRKILGGEGLDHRIDQHLASAEIIPLLVSADFIASDYCWEKEVSLALQRHDSGEATVVPIMLRTCDWTRAPFGKLQGLPKDMRPITSWEDRDAAWTNVALGIRAIAEDEGRQRSA